MNQSEENKFNKAWQDAFKDASETPPSSIWKALEEHLDNEPDKVVPLVWWKNTRILYVAASVAVLLLAGIGVWMNDHAGKQAMVSGNVQGVTQEPLSTIHDHEKEIAVNNRETTAANKEKPESGTDNKAQEAVIPPELSRSGGITAGRDSQAVTDSRIAISAVKEHSGIKAKLPAGFTPSSEDAPLRASADIPDDTRSGYEAVKTGQVIQEEMTGDSEQALMSGLEIAFIEQGNKPWIEKQGRFNKRLVFYRPQLPQEEEEDQKPEKKEYYAGAGVMPSMFNPNVSIASPSVGMSFAKSSSGTKTEVLSRGGTSFAMQTYGGIKISKHWSVETGINYLRGNSVFESNGYVMDVMNLQAVNALESALVSGNVKLADKMPQYSMVANGASNANKLSTYYVDVKKGFQNNYSFLQLPVQAGYTIAPDHKLSYTLLGGLVGNLFLKNELDLTTGGTLITSVSDGTYQALHWSATSGVRLNYRLTGNWSTILTGTYQKTFYDAGKMMNAVQFKPQLFGVGWGVRLNF